jgi:hypothetical protein
MEFGDILCPTCQAIFRQDLASFRPGPPEDENTLKYLTFQHHSEMGEFRKAALGNCLICLRNWRRTNDKSRRMISNLLSSIDPIDFRMEYAIRSWNFRDRDENAYSQAPLWLHMEWWINGARFYMFYALLSRTGESTTSCLLFPQATTHNNLSLTHAQQPLSLTHTHTHTHTHKNKDTLLTLQFKTLN